MCSGRYLIATPAGSASVLRVSRCPPPAGTSPAPRDGNKLVGPGGWLVVTDALLMGPWHHEASRSETHHRAPTDYEASHVLLRSIRCVNGKVQVSMECSPVFDYGQTRVEWSYTGDGYHDAVAKAPQRSRRRSDDAEVDRSDLELRLTTDLNVGFEGASATARTLLKEGDRRFVALSWSDHPPPRTVDEVAESLQWTCHHWQHWLDRGRFPDHRWRDHLQRSALTLKGLSFAPTGAIMAAATTSLPETPGGERNWDYRYTWIRDTVATLWAFNTLGLDWEANDFFNFIAEIADAEGGHLQLMYGVGGERVLTEKTLDHLAGYEDARPVRIGNGAYSQRQHDVWGAIVRAIDLHRGASRRGSALADCRDPGCACAGALARTGPGYLGGPLGSPALHEFESRLLDGRRRRRAHR